MNILVNSSNLSVGGGVQVTDSFCRSLSQFPEHNFIVVLTDKMESIKEKIILYPNVKIYTYNIKNNLKTYLFARDEFLDNIVIKEKVDVVFSVFAPTWWTPKKPHFCGFALAHLVIPESPFYKMLSFKQLLKRKIENLILTFFYWRCSSCYYTENEMITERLKKIFPFKNIYTVTNYYNQIFDEPNNQILHKLPTFDGITILTICTAYPHKNIEISIPIAKKLRYCHPDFKFRFVFTITKVEICDIPIELMDNFVFIGKVGIEEVPSLYQQSDICFQPTLLECFTATYAESMRMDVPIVTTDLVFARGLCGNAAIYYSALDASEAASALYNVATDSKLMSQLKKNGRKQLSYFDNYNERSSKIIQIIEKIATSN